MKTRRKPVKAWAVVEPFVRTNIEDARQELETFFAERDKGRMSKFTRKEVDRKVGNALRVLNWLLSRPALKAK